MSAAPGPKKTPEMEAIEKMEERLSGQLTAIEKGNQHTQMLVSRQRGEYLVLRSRLKRCEGDVESVTTLAHSHEKKINYALGGTAVIAAGAAWIGWAIKQVLGKLFHNG